MRPYRTPCCIAGALGLVLAACAPSGFVYAPVRTTSAEVEGAPAVVYDMPLHDAKGDVRVAMLGLAALQPVDVADNTLRAIHVVVEVHNRSGEVWSFDPAEARAELTTRRERSEVYATSARIRPLPQVDVAPQSQAVIHLYFALPLHLQAERLLPRFDVIWSIRMGEHAVTERTAFQRFIAAPPVDPDAGGSAHAP